MKEPVLIVYSLHSVQQVCFVKGDLAVILHNEQISIEVRVVLVFGPGRNVNGIRWYSDSLTYDRDLITYIHVIHVLLHSDDGSSSICRVKICWLLVKKVAVEKLNAMKKLKMSL